MQSTKLVRRGFTLIELLVVIAIIAILAAILFPVFGRARENARRSSCQSNLKQVGLGIMQYTQDYDELFPAVYNGNWPGRWHWMDCVQPYVKSDQVFNCPSDADASNKYVPVATGGTTILGSTPDNYGSYAVSNAYFNNAAAAPEWGSPMSQKAQNDPGNSSVRIDSPSTSILAGDGNGAFQMAWADSSKQPTKVTATTNPNTMEASSGVTDTNLEGRFVGRHLETLNLLFADGHVKAMRLDALLEKSTKAPTYGTTAGYIVGLRYFTRYDD